MTQDLTILTITAASIGFLHTLLGPDHYIPFIVMSRARKWSLFKTTSVTLLCGIGHIAGSVVLGTLGVALGIAVMKIEAVESFRGSLAAWFLIAFGLVYFVWGLRKALRNKPHKHYHAHIDGTNHIHKHIHNKEHVHVRKEAETKNITPWILFTIFFLGPCEPLIPILMYPAAKNNLFALILVTSVFGAVTIMTMLGIVLISSFGINLIPAGRLERYAHTLAGAMIFLCGIGIQFLGL